VFDTSILPPCIARELAREPARIRAAFERYLEGAAWIVIDRARAPMLRQHWHRFKKRCNAAGRRDGIAPTRWRAAPPEPEFDIDIDDIDDIDGDAEPPTTTPDYEDAPRGTEARFDYGMRGWSRSRWASASKADCPRFGSSPYQAPYVHTAEQDRRHRDIIARERRVNPDEVEIELRAAYSWADVPAEWRGRR